MVIRCLVKLMPRVHTGFHPNLKNHRDFSGDLMNIIPMDSSELRKTTMEISRVEDLLAEKCGKIASALKPRKAVDLGGMVEDIPASPETFEIVVRFCEGREPNLTAENVVPLACLAHALDMSESQCRDNLLRRCITFINRRILPAWNEALRAFRSSEPVLRHAHAIGLLSPLLDSLVDKAISDPRLVDDPDDVRKEPDNSSLSARRKLFSSSWRSEDLVVLPMRLYEPLVAEMLRRGVPSRHVAASIRRYARKWAFGKGNGDVSEYGRNSRRDIVEAVVRLLPHEEYDEKDRGFVLEMLACAKALEANSECRESLESRIGRRLHKATVEELSAVASCDVDCLRRVLKHFYRSNESALGRQERVAELMEEFLVTAAGMEKKSFAEVADMAAGICSLSGRSLDAVYNGVDVYLGKHADLSESEREEVCRVLDFERMSPQACEHAARNQRLPMRAIVQVLFAAQLQLRDSIVAAQSSHAEEEEYEEEEARLLLPGHRNDDDYEIVAMSEKLGELERECMAMKREMVIGGKTRSMVVQKKVSLWKEMKRKFGCVGSSVSDCNNCQVSNKKRKMKMKRH